MKIALDHLQHKPISLHIEEPVGYFPVLAAMQQDKVCIFTGPVICDVTATREYDNIRVNGRASVPVSHSCSRCLADFDSFVDLSFTLIFRKDTQRHSGDESEVELNEIDLLSSVYEGDEIDLTHEIGEQVAMEIPLKPLCDEECKGLCHNCGTDLNSSDCSCSKETTSFAFSALKNFKVSR